tara:strand:+ start:4185 stop:4373 length:189 start_codon:yes stop_codon:yes gene_type:complete
VSNINKEMHEYHLIDWAKPPPYSFQKKDKKSKFYLNEVVKINNALTANRTTLRWVRIDGEYT